MLILIVHKECSCISVTLPFHNHIVTYRSAFILALFSPELKVIVSFSYHYLSGVRLSVCMNKPPTISYTFLFSASFLKPLGHYLCTKHPFIELVHIKSYAFSNGINLKLLNICFYFKTKSSQNPFSQKS